MQDIEWLDPLVMRADIDLAAVEHVHIPHELSGLAALVVSRDNSCRFCYAASRMLLRLTGMPEDRIGKLEEDLETAQLDTPVRLALDLARRISRSNPLPSRADKKALRDAGYGEDAIKELAFIAAENVFHNRAATLPALPPELPERLARSSFLGLLRPLLKQPLRRLQKKGRAKALIFAVIARGLGCAHSEREAFRLLVHEGLDADQVEEILAHLGSTELDRIEALLVPYARETIWYEPASVQRSGRRLQQELTTPQLLEVIGIASVANMVCRLAILLDEG